MVNIACENRPPEAKSRPLHAANKSAHIRYCRPYRVSLLSGNSSPVIESASSTVAMQNGRGEDIIVRSIRDVPVTEERKPYLNPGGRLQHIGTFSP
jgi:hypothetical protein